MCGNISDEEEEEDKMEIIQGLCGHVQGVAQFMEESINSKWHLSKEVLHGRNTVSHESNYVGEKNTHLRADYLTIISIKI